MKKIDNSKIFCRKFHYLFKSYIESKKTLYLQDVLTIV